MKPPDVYSGKTKLTQAQTAFVHRSWPHLEDCAWGSSFLNHRPLSDFFLVAFNDDDPDLAEVAARLRLAGRPPMKVISNDNADPAFQALISSFVPASARPKGSVRVLATMSPFDSFGFVLPVQCVEDDRSILPPWSETPVESQRRMERIESVLFDQVASRRTTFGMDAQGMLDSLAPAFAPGARWIKDVTDHQASLRAGAGKFPAMYVFSDAVFDRDMGPEELFEWLPNRMMTSTYGTALLERPQSLAFQKGFDKSFVIGQEIWTTGTPPRRDRYKGVRKGQYLAWVIAATTPLPASAANRLMD